MHESGCDCTVCTVFAGSPVTCVSILSEEVSAMMPSVLVACPLYHFAKFCALIFDTSSINPFFMMICLLE
jgi:hypothetical protein